MPSTKISRKRWSLHFYLSLSPSRSNQGGRRRPVKCILANSTQTLRIPFIVWGEEAMELRSAPVLSLIHGNLSSLCTPKNQQDAPDVISHPIVPIADSAIFWTSVPSLPLISPHTSSTCFLPIMCLPASLAYLSTTTQSQKQADAPTWPGFHPFLNPSASVSPLSGLRHSNRRASLANHM